MTAFGAAVDASFAAFGTDAVYTPAAGGPAPVRVIVRHPDRIVGLGATRVHAATATFELLAREVANPRPGDQLIVDGQTFVLQGEPERRGLDPDRVREDRPAGAPRGARPEVPRYYRRTLATVHG